MSGSSFLIEYSVTPSLTEGGNPNVVINTQPEVPILQQSITSKIEALLSRLSVSSYVIIRSSLNSIFTSLQASTAGLSTESAWVQALYYTEQFEQTNSILVTSNPNQIPNMPKQNELKSILKNLLTSYTTVMTSDEMAIWSKIPTKTNQRPANQTTVMKRPPPKSLSTLTTQLKSSSTGSVAITKTINNLVASLSGSKSAATSVVSSPINASSSDIIDLVDSFRGALTELQNAVSSDPNVANHVSGLLTQIQNKLALGEHPNNGGSKLRGFVGLIKTGIPPTSKPETKMALINFETIVDKIFNVTHTVPTLKGSNVTKNNIKAMISNLQTQQASLSVSYQSKINSGTMSQADTATYIDSLSKINSQISSLQKQLTKSSSSSLTMSATEITPVKKFVSGLGERIGKSQFGSLSRRVISMAPRFSGSGLTAANVSSISAQLSSVVSANTTIQGPTATTSLSSILQVETELVGSDLTVRCTGTLNGISYGLSYTLKVESLTYISTEAFMNVVKISESAKRKMCNDSGIVPKSTIVTSQEIWNAYLIFLFTYLSISVYCIVDQNNSLGIQLPETDHKNLMFLLRPDTLQSFSNVAIPVSGLRMSDDSKQILNLGTSRNWPFYMYKRTNPETVTSSSLGSSVVQTLSSIIGTQTA